MTQVTTVQSTHEVMDESELAATLGVLGPRKMALSIAGGGSIRECLFA